MIGEDVLRVHEASEFRDNAFLVRRVRARTLGGPFAASVLGRDGTVRGPHNNDQAVNGLLIRLHVQQGNSNRKRFRWLVRDGRFDFNFRMLLVAVTQQHIAAIRFK